MDKPKERRPYVWEAEYLGPPPYRFVGIWDGPSKSLQEVNPEAYNNAMRNGPRLANGLGNCAICGTYIVQHMMVRAGDGRIWGIGNECISKRKGPVATAARRAVLDKQRAARKATAVSQRLAIQEMLLDPHIQEMLRARPHPNSYWADQGRTEYDWAEWMLKNAGAAGIQKLYRYLSKL